jgi:hypothetical protein
MKETLWVRLKRMFDRYVNHFVLPLAVAAAMDGEGRCATPAPLRAQAPPLTIANTGTSWFQ